MIRRSEFCALKEAVCVTECVLKLLILTADRHLASNPLSKPPSAIQDGARRSIGNLPLDTFYRDVQDKGAWLPPWIMSILRREEHLLVCLHPSTYSRLDEGLSQIHD